jgi:hypothetical protein
VTHRLPQRPWGGVSNLPHGFLLRCEALQSPTIP